MPSYVLPVQIKKKNNNQKCLLGLLFLLHHKGPDQTVISRYESSVTSEWQKKKNLDSFVLPPQSWVLYESREKNVQFAAILSGREINIKIIGASSYRISFLRCRRGSQ